MFCSGNIIDDLTVSVVDDLVDFIEQYVFQHKYKDKEIDQGGKNGK